MKRVKFTQMKNGTKEDYLLLEKHEKKFIKETPQRILMYMKSLTSKLEGYKVSRLEHSLQSATRALCDKAEDEMIVAALLHDIGDELAFHNHSEFAASILKYKGHKYYKDTITFCENWDQKSFDPNYKSLTLKDFEPYVKKIFSRTPYTQ